MSTGDQELVQRALTGDRTAARALAGRLLPVISREVGFLLASRAAVAGREPRQDLKDMCQDVLRTLLADRGQELARWDPTRGRTLDSFVQLVARRRVARVLGGDRGEPSDADPVAPDELETLQESDAREADELAARRDLATALDRLHAHMTTRDAEIFELVFVEERQPEEVCAQLGMSRVALNTWRYRLRKLARTLAGEVLGRPPDPRRDAEAGA